MYTALLRFRLLFSLCLRHRQFFFVGIVGCEGTHTHHQFLARLALLWVLFGDVASGVEEHEVGSHTGDFLERKFSEIMHICTMSETFLLSSSMPEPLAQGSTFFSSWSCRKWSKYTIKNEGAHLEGVMWN